MTLSPLRIGIVGLGTVGCGVVSLLEDHGDEIAAKAGRPVQIAGVSARNKNRKRSVSVDRYRWFDNPLAMTQDGDIDCVVELIGGAEGIANEVVRAALTAGKAVVTANKALLANHGFELAQMADAAGVPLYYEAAAAGAIPIIKTLREGLAGNEIHALYGILNGTCNYILTEMRETGKDFPEVLAAAQKLGYAEADPHFDIGGIDTAHKLSLLSALAFGHRPDFKGVEITGIEHIAARDIEFAGELGYRIKLLGIARCVNEQIMQRVEPCLVPVESALGAVEGVFNAVFVESDYADRGMLTGRGAGQKPTASAVASDLVDLARGHSLPVFGVPAWQLETPERMDAGRQAAHYYMRMNVVDKPGVLADVAATLRDHSISVESMFQRGRDPGNPVSIVMTTHGTLQKDMASAAKALTRLECLNEPPCVLRIETF